MANKGQFWSPPSGAYNAAVDMVDRNVSEGRGDKVAFIDPATRLTYAQLQDRCDRFANALRALGVRCEHRIVLIMTDTVDLPTAFWGAIKAGIVPIPLNTLLTEEQWTYMIEDSRADAVVVSAELMDRVGPVVAEVGKRRKLHVIVSGAAAQGQTSFAALLSASPAKAQAADTRADEVAFWLYSSGSTGMPKGTRHLHASPMHTAKLVAGEILNINESDVVFSAAKLFFAYGLGNGMSFPMSVGATAVLMPDRPTPDSVMGMMRAHNPTIFCGVPTLFA